jgi:Carboxypeptidase regulatory-like domain
MKRIKYYAILLLVASINYSQDRGTITGTVQDRETQAPLVEAVVQLLNSEFKTVTDQNGRFEFRNVPLGNHEIKVSHLGYETFVQTDVVVLSSRPAEVRIELLISNITTEQIDVEGKYFQKQTDVSTSSYNLDFEEIRRAPGAVEDISRMVQIMPGVSPANDQRNDLS